MVWNTVYEQQTKWNIKEYHRSGKNKKDDENFCSRTNLPTTTMEFMDFPFVNSKSFVTAGEVLKYLEDYCDNFNLRKYIKVRFCIAFLFTIDENYLIFEYAQK